MLPGTLIPTAFATTPESCAPALDMPSGVAGRPMPAYKSLPDYVCGADAVPMDARPCILPAEFSLQPTPPDSMIANFSSQAYPARTCNSSWKSNLFVLVMGDGYAPIVGRGLRLAHRPCTLALEIMYSSYSIFFDQSVLRDKSSGVQFYPAFVPTHPSGDVNYYALQDSDYTRLQNVVPPAPPGAYLAFGRLSGPMAVKPHRHGGLTSVIKDHPVVNGDRLFPVKVLEQARTKMVGAMQEGGIGFLVFRPDYELFGLEPEFGGGQLFPLYCRCAFGPEALDSKETQQRIVSDALAFAVSNSPKDAYGSPFVSVVHVMEPVAVPATTDACERVFEQDKTINAADCKAVTKWLLASHICKHSPAVTWESARREAAYWFSLGEYIYAQNGVWSEEEAITIEMSEDVSVHAEVACTVMHDSTHRLFSPCEIQPIYEAYVMAKSKAQHRRAASNCSPVLYYTAPPDSAKFGDKPVYVFGVLLSVRLGVKSTSSDMSMFERRLCRRTAGDIGTRLMCDMMLFNPVLAVTPCVSECMLSLFTDKAPGLLNVRSACKGIPAVATSTSDHRRIKNAHPCVAGIEIYTLDPKVHTVPKHSVEPVPVLTREEADANLFLRALIRGGRTPYEVPGVEVSIYDSNHKCQTIVAGTRHSWPVKGAIIWNRIMKPKTKDYPWGFFDESVTEQQRLDALKFLFPPDYNSAACQIYSSTGAWKEPTTTHRQWKKPYGVDVSVMHKAMWWWYSYPAFISDKTHPSAIDIWRLKMLAEAEVHWMGRWGRIIRQLLNKRRRKVRIDYPRAVFRNYYCILNRVEGAPIAPMALTAINVFKDSLILGEQQVVGDKQEADDDESDSDEEEAMFEEEEEDEEQGEEDEEEYSVDPLAMLYGSSHNDVYEVTTAKSQFDAVSKAKRPCL